MKKVLAIALSLLMVFSILPIGMIMASADATPIEGELALQLKASSPKTGTVTQGTDTQLKITLNITKNDAEHGLTDFGIWVKAPAGFILSKALMNSDTGAGTQNQSKSPTGRADDLAYYCNTCNDLCLNPEDWEDIDSWDTDESGPYPYQSLMKTGVLYTLTYNIDWATVAAGSNTFTLDPSGSSFNFSAQNFDYVYYTPELTNLTVTVVKSAAKPEAPDAPTVESATPYSVTLVEEDGCEYSMDATNWQASPVFEDLDPATEYNFYQRVAAEGTTEASDASEALVYTTPALFGNASLILGGELGLKVEAYVGEAEDAYMLFKIAGAQPVGLPNVDTESKLVEQVDAEYLENGYYSFICPVDVLQMNNDIEITFFDGNEEHTLAAPITVKAYLEALKATSDNQKVLNLVDALYDYGHYSQLALQETHGFTLGEEDTDDYRPMPAANEELEPDYVLADAAYNSKIGEMDGLRKATIALDLEHKTTIILYLYVRKEAAALTPTLADPDDNVTLEIEWLEDYVAAPQWGDLCYKITLTDIAAEDLNKVYTIDVNEYLTFNVSALGYAKAVMGSGAASDAYALAMTALYNYYTAVQAFNVLD